MKKLLQSLLIAVLFLAVVLIFRAQTYFDDRQVAVEAPPMFPAVDLDAASARLAAAVRYPTISYDDPSRIDKAAFEGLREHMAASFPRVYGAGNPRIVSEHSLLFKFPGIRGDLKPALFMGHVDVVPVDEATRDQWAYAPFSGAIEDGVIWGRGVMDDKVTVFALLEAMELLLASGGELERTIYFAFGHDEEVGGPRGAASIADLLADEGVEFEFVLDEGGAIVEGLVPGIEGAVATVGIAEKGFVNIRLTVNAEGGHSSQPPEHTAAGILSKAIVSLEANQFPANLDYTRLTLDYLGSQLGFGERLLLANFWLFEPLLERAMSKTPSAAAGIRSTIAATMLEGSSKSNILPTRASAVINVRIMPGDSVDSVKAHFIRSIDDSRVEVTSFMENEPSPVSPTDSLGYRLIEKNIRMMDDSVVVAPYLVFGGTDSKHFYDLSPNIYRFFMVKANAQTLKRIHGINEQLPLADYLSAIQFFYQLLEDSAQG